MLQPLQPAASDCQGTLALFIWGGIHFPQILLCIRIFNTASYLCDKFVQVNFICHWSVENKLPDVWKIKTDLSNLWDIVLHTTTPSHAISSY